MQRVLSGVMPGLILIALCVLAPPTGAEEAAPDAEDFEKSLQRIENLLGRAQHEKGLRELERALKRHEKTPWARGYRADLCELSERLAFAAAFEAPSAQDVVSGTIEKYEPKSGYLRIRYTSEASADLRRDAQGYVYFPARARGSYLVEIYGSAYPYAFDDAPSLEISAGADPKTKRMQNWLVSFGSPTRVENEQETWLPARIIHTDGGSEKTISEVARSPAQAGERYLLQVKVNDTRIHAAVNRKPVGAARKPKGLYGEIRFSARSWETLIFSGTIEPSWIQDRIDEAVQQQLVTFRRTYTRSDHLPAWLFEESDASAVAAAREELPAPLAGKARVAAGRVASFLQEGDHRQARSALSLLAEAGAPTPVLDFFEARIGLEEGREAAGLEALERVLTGAPEFLPGQLLQGTLLRRLDRPEESLAAFHRALTCHPRDPLAYEVAIQSLLRSGRADAAASVVRTAARTGVTSATLDELSTAVSKATRGPTWNRVFEYKSRNYHVFSNTDKETCVEASKLLEQALTAYKVGFHWVGRSSERHYKVYLFGGKAGFDRYWNDLHAFTGHAPEHVAGVYIPIVQQLLLWTLGDKDAMLQTLRHEGFHQYLDRLMDGVPIWLNEGLAVYHENGRFERGKLRFGAVHEDRRDLLRKTGLRPLAELLSMKQEQFYFGTDAFQNYAQAWAFVHLLKEGPERYRSLLRTLIRDMQEDPMDEVMERLLPPETLRELDTALRTHVAKMR